MSMKLHAGDTAPDFSLPDQSGRPVTLSGLLADGPVVVFFYPRAMTPGCTAESCHFRDLRGELDPLGARAVGISADSVARQSTFAERNPPGLPLLSDLDRPGAPTSAATHPGPWFTP